MDAKKPARAPLGVVYEGRCVIGGEQRSEACNFGYATGRCEVFPPDAMADAVRFTVLQGRTMYVLEKDHSPVQYGEASELHGTLARQAEVFRLWMNR